MSQRSKRAGSAISMLSAVIICLPASAAHRPIQKRSGPPPRGARVVVIDVRPTQRNSDSDGMSLRDHALMSHDIQTLFEAEHSRVARALHGRSRWHDQVLLRPRAGSSTSLIGLRKTHERRPPHQEGGVLFSPESSVPLKCTTP